MESELGGFLFEMSDVSDTLLNFVELCSVVDIFGPKTEHAIDQAGYEALTPLAKLLPGEHLGYAGIAGDSSSPEPWSKSFRQLTVRQLMNRISEHIGPRGAWILSGSKDDRFFFSFQYGFQR